MKIISHRGIIAGDSKNENTVEKIENALDIGYDCEIDLWYCKNNFYLGHDKPVHSVSVNWIFDNSIKLWIHCKNLDCIKALQFSSCNYFWHENDQYTLTSKKIIWCYPKNISYDEDLICVMPEWFIEKKKLKSYAKKIKAYGVCTDYPELFDIENDNPSLFKKAS